MIINKRLSEFSLKLRAAIKRLSFGDGGFRDAIRYKPDADAFVTIDDNDILIGWATYLDRWRGSEKVVMLYVRASMRRRGVGSQLLSAVSNKHGSIHICPWDERSVKFFLNFWDEENFKICRTYRKLENV